MPVRTVRDVMGMPWTVEVRDERVPPGLIEALYADLEWVDRTFSTFRADSEIERLNRGELDLEGASPEVREVLELSDAHSDMTGGCFSARPSGRLDPSGLVKGWAIARAARLLLEAGCESYLVDGAGDVVVRGGRAAGALWRIGIRHPLERDKVARVIEASDLAVATSGTYEKGPHLIDPRSGRPADGWLSFTVVGPDIVAADVFATAGFVMGADGLEFVASRPGYDAYAIDRDLVGSWTSGFPRRPEPAGLAAPYFKTVEQ
ncbi:MAG TPA: FAD:protein FMN transferase [Candidatus Dormibacteraeota bacterium]